jgi:hypothetical protein
MLPHTAPPSQQQSASHASSSDKAAVQRSSSDMHMAAAGRSTARQQTSSCRSQHSTAQHVAAARAVQHSTDTDTFDTPCEGWACNAIRLLSPWGCVVGVEVHSGSIPCTWWTVVLLLKACLGYMGSQGSHACLGILFCCSQLQVVGFCALGKWSVGLTKWSVGHTKC